MLHGVNAAAGSLHDGISSLYHSGSEQSQIHRRLHLTVDR